MLTKGEAAVTPTGIVRLPGGAEVKLTHVSALSPQASNRSTVTANRGTPYAQARNATSGTRTASPTIRQLAGGSTIQRKTVAAGSANASAVQIGGVRAGQQRAGRTAAAVGNKSAVTPEQKILQLSKSGDLKVTKKLMTQEDVQQRQQQMRQPPPPSQVQIQKVQQLATSNRSATTMSIGSGVTAILKERYSPSPDESILCPVTGKLLGPAGEAQQQQEQLQKEQAAAEVLQAAQLMEQMQQQQLQQQQQQQLPQQHINVLLQQGAEQQHLQQQQQQQQQLQDLDQTMLLATGEHQMITNEDGTPLLVTGDDGTVYQVAGKNAEGQTILVTQGPDGEQHFAYVATVENDENQVLTLNNALAEGVAQYPTDEQAVNDALAVAGEGQYLVKTVQEDGTTQVIAMTEAEFNQHQALMQQQQEQTQMQQLIQPGPTTTVTVSTNGGQLCIQTIEADGTETSIPAELVQADVPSPG